MSNQNDQWLTIRSAAAALGVSDLTIRRRIKDNKVAHKLDNGKYFVNLSALPPQMPVTPSPTEVPDTPDGGDYAIDEYSDDTEYTPKVPMTVNLQSVLPEFGRLAERAGKVSLLEEQVRELEARHRTLQSDMLSLATRNGWLESKLEERENQVKLLTDSQHRVSWWKRLLGMDDGS